jgi:hypothetical protein
MKTLLIALLAGLVTTAWAQELTAPIGPQKPVRAMPTPPPVAVRPQVQGVVPRAFGRGRNPLRMLNPGAPAQYGTGEQSVAYNPFTGRYDQIKLFEIVF